MALSKNTRGAALMSAGMAAFVVNDTFMKLISDEMGLYQAVFLRGFGTTLAFIGLVWWFGGFRLRLSRRDGLLVGLRTLTDIGTTYFFLTALFHMPLANVTAIFQSLPLVITLASALLLREQVGWRRMTAIAVGFLGVLLIVRPGTDGFNIYVVMALISVLCAALRDLLTRRLSDSVPSTLVALAGAAGIAAAAGLASLTEPWVVPSAAGWWQLAAMTACIILGYLLSVMAMRAGDLSFVSPFRYTGLLWALVLGLAVFGDWPSGLTILGAAIIVATGIYTLHRERMQNRARVAGGRPLAATIPPQGRGGAG